MLSDFWREVPAKNRDSLGHGGCHGGCHGRCHGGCHGGMVSRPWQLAELGHAMHHVMFRHGWPGGSWPSVKNGRMLHLEVEGCFLPWTLHTSGLWISWLADHFCILYVNWPQKMQIWLKGCSCNQFFSHPNAPKSLFSYQLWSYFFHRWMTIRSLTRSRDMCHQHFVFFTVTSYGCGVQLWPTENMGPPHNAVLSAQRTRTDLLKQQSFKPCWGAMKGLTISDEKSLKQTEINSRT